MSRPGHQAAEAYTSISLNRQANINPFNNSILFFFQISKSLHHSHILFPISVIFQYETHPINKCSVSTVDHYCDAIMGTVASQITSLTIVYTTVYSDADQSKHQSSASPAFVWGIHRRPVNSPHKWPVTRKMFPFDDIIMYWWFNASAPTVQSMNPFISSC